MITAIPDIIQAGHELIDKYILDKPQAEQAKNDFDLLIRDKQSAREREIEVTKATGKPERITPLLALILVIGFFVIIFVILFCNEDIFTGSKRDVVMLLLGNLVTFPSAVVGYYFGSSKNELRLRGAGK